MIALQCSQATYVCGFKAWLELGDRVRKGERAIRILAPQKVRLASDEQTEDDVEETRIFFRAIPVFDRSQVDALPDRDPAPLEPPREPITGNSHAHLIPPLDVLAGELGFRVEERDDTGPGGG